MELDRRNVQHGAIPVGKILAAQAGPVPLGSVLAPTPGLEWGVLPPGTDGYVLTASSGSVLPDGSQPGIAWASPCATSPIAAGSLLGNPTGSSTVPEAITLGAGLSFSGTTLVASGGGGTPGGSSGQIQYDNAGSFGGFTMSGDATLVTSTGVITISPGAVTLAKQANFPASSLMGNPTGSSAAPSAITLGTNLSFSGLVLERHGGGRWRRFQCGHDGPFMAHGQRITDHDVGHAGGDGDDRPDGQRVPRHSQRIERGRLSADHRRGRPPDHGPHDHAEPRARSSRRLPAARSRSTWHSATSRV